MQGVAISLLVITSVILIILVVMQSGKSEGLGAISGGAEQLFGKKKARGIDAVLQRATIIASIVFFLLTFALAYII
ncbi:preprotein translocase subunit SecG [Amphibacillus sediminis]|uniref:preprotein translocase subunit SecG n=1 Tax=Amphibacillus sediminis TaxID=360185 RepID=UPI00082B59D6|nr:preprotein translocase subunit SecG [Amphibacillus sediminis]